MRQRNYHQARWNEPIICEMGSPGERGVLIPSFTAEEWEVDIPRTMKRDTPPSLPEISQVEVLRHYLRLSQENLGAGLIPDFGMATSTMKYNPPINEQLVRNPKLSELHPLQDESTIQGILAIMFQLEQFLKEISGMDGVSLQPRAGSQAIYANAAMMRAYHTRRGEGEQRNEIITTIFSHPSDAAVPGAAGFKVITLYPQPNGYPDLKTLKSLVSNRTAGLFITNPDDTGIFNPLIREFTKVVHDVGGLCAYDQANANGLLGIVRARESGFDLSQFNLHKTFSTPHASGGPATGASCVTDSLADFLPTPTVGFDGKNYYLDYSHPYSIGKVGSFYGVVANFVRAYAWIMAHGSDGLREVTETAVLNNNYLMRKILEIPGICAPYAPGQFRIDQTRYSWKKLIEDTGLHIADISNRTVDFAMHFFQSHHPYVVEDPATLEPTESYSQHDIDEYVAVWARIATEAYCRPELVRDAPYNAPIHQMTHAEFLTNPDKWSPTWRAFRKKHPGGFAE